MKQMGLWVRTRVTLVVEGLNMDRLLAELAQKCGVLTGVSRLSLRKLRLTMTKSDYKKFLSFVPEMCYTIEVERERGLVPALLRLRLRAGLLCGVLAATACLLAYSSFLWRVEVTGCELTAVSEVHTALAALGVHPGTPRGGIDTRGVQEGLRARLPHAAFVGVRLEGTALLVTVTEARPALPAGDPGTSLHILARLDGRVTRVIALRGTPQVKAGDAVRAGDVLVAGYTSVPTEDGTGIVTTPVRAEADVFVERWTYATVVWAPMITEYRRTGQYGDVVSRKLGPFVRPQTGKAHEYRFFESETETTTYFSNLFMPYVVTRTRFYELEEVTQTRDFAAHRDALIEQARQEVAQKITGNGLDVTVSVTQSEGYYKITAAAREEVLASFRP
ncbi:MAG: sporulation protein YqfD [Clostridiales bacterium]|jgi:sporulation protein YqfD|nr:sporulation protein YqfD [Clostridiales bacterium]